MPSTAWPLICLARTDSPAQRRENRLELSILTYWAGESTLCLNQGWRNPCIHLKVDRPSYGTQTSVFFIGWPGKPVNLAQLVADTFCPFMLIRITHSWHSVLLLLAQQLWLLCNNESTLWELFRNVGLIRGKVIECGPARGIWRFLWGLDDVDAELGIGNAQAAMSDWQSN